MVITQPTIDDFSDTTVMRVIRKIVNYICSDSGLVAQINDNDITGFTSSYKDNVLKIDATKGDGSKLPVCNVTIEGGGSSTGNPYPTAISGTVGVDGNIKFTITMSSGSPLTTTINMNHFASADDLSNLQEQVTGLKLTSSGNNMSINGTSASIVNSIGGSVSNGNLKITVNGVESGDIPLPETEVKPIATVSSPTPSPIIEFNNVTVNYETAGESVSCISQDADNNGVLIYKGKYGNSFIGPTGNLWYSKNIRRNKKAVTPFTITIPQKTFSIGIEDGEYICPIDMLLDKSLELNRAVTDKDNYENEHIVFTVSNNVATIEETEITINSSFYGPSSITTDIYRLRIIVDRLIKVN